MEHNGTFKALQVDCIENNNFVRRVVNRQLDDLLDNELLIKVQYSSLNYKDALSATGHKGVTRQFPHTPGIDAAGTVITCKNGAFVAGDQVLVTGYDLGMETDGGWGEYIRIPVSWALKLPEGLTMREAMALGTAGFTAALSVMKLYHAGVTPEKGTVLVTGATGGVGSLAVAILKQAGYVVTASTGKTDDADFLRMLGADEVISREDVKTGVERAMMKERWAGVVDVVGGETLVAAIKSTFYGGAVTCCGLTGSSELNMNVFPFILRGVSLIGIDSVNCPYRTRVAVWEKLASAWKPKSLGKIITETSLEQMETHIESMLHGATRGRIVVNLQL